MVRYREWAEEAMFDDLFEAVAHANTLGTILGQAEIVIVGGPHEPTKE